MLFTGVSGLLKGVLGFVGAAQQRLGITHINQDFRQGLFVAGFAQQALGDLQVIDGDQQAVGMSARADFAVLATAHHRIGLLQTDVADLRTQGGAGFSGGF